MGVILALIITAYFLFKLAKREEKKLDQATTQAQAVVHGGGSCATMILATLAFIAALILIGGKALPSG